MLGQFLKFMAPFSFAPHFELKHRVEFYFDQLSLFILKNKANIRTEKSLIHIITNEVKHIVLKSDQISPISPIRHLAPYIIFNGALLFSCQFLLKNTVLNNLLIINGLITAGTSLLAMNIEKLWAGNRQIVRAKLTMKKTMSRKSQEKNTVSSDKVSPPTARGF